MKNEFPFDLPQLFRKFQNNPGSLWFLLGLVGMGLFLLVGGNSRSVAPSQVAAPAKAESGSGGIAGDLAGEQQLENDVARILKQVSGVGRVKVDVTLKTASRKVWERQSRNTKRVAQQQGEMDSEESSSDELVLAKTREGTDTPILKEELAPEVQGVLVVAEGATDSRIKQLLTQTVMTILDLPAHRVMIIAGKDESR